MTAADPTSTRPPSSPVAIPPSTSTPVGDVVTQPEVRCRCAESPDAWRKCPLPQHDHSTWTEHGANCPASCTHPDAGDAAPHAHGCPVEQIHRVWTTDQGVDPWVLAEETLRFVQTWENRRCTCVGRPPNRPEGVPLTAVYDPDSGLWRPPTALGGSEPTSKQTLGSLGGHCCFAGCRLVTCHFCREQRCLYDLHLCEPESRDPSQTSTPIDAEPDASRSHTDAPQGREGSS